MPETDRDFGAETARFQAFATHHEEDLPAPWQMRAPGAKIGVLVLFVVAAAVIAAIFGGFLVG